LGIGRQEKEGETEKEEEKMLPISLASIMPEILSLTNTTMVYVK
jgi:hypothetical protein